MTTCAYKPVACNGVSMKALVIQTVLMLGTVFYAASLSPCAKTHPHNQDRHLEQVLAVAGMGQRSSSIDYTVLESAGEVEESEVGTVTTPEPTPVEERPADTQEPEVATGNPVVAAGEAQKETYLIYFSAAWCGPCKQQKPVIEEIKAAGEFKVYIIDIDEDPNAAAQWGVSTVPTMEVVRDGKRAWRKVGNGNSRQEIEAQLRGQ